jgi:hypothetical protein
MNACVVLLLGVVAFASSLQAPLAAGVVWVFNVSDESYWDASVSNGEVFVGTSGEFDCRVDVFSLDQGVHLARHQNICHVDAFGSNFGAVGYHYPDMKTLFNVSGVVHSSTLTGQYYYAEGLKSAVAVRAGEMLVWGDRPGAKDINDRVACLYHVAASTGTLSKGPCLTHFGDGESADVSANI